MNRRGASTALEWYQAERLAAGQLAVDRSPRPAAGPDQGPGPAPTPQRSSMSQPQFGHHQDHALAVEELERPRALRTSSARVGSRERRYGWASSSSVGLWTTSRPFRESLSAPSSRSCSRNDLGLGTTRTS